MGIGLHGKGLKAPLLQRPGTGGAVRGMPALGMGDGQPAQRLGKLFIATWPQQQMPVVGHHTVGQQANTGASDGRLARARAESVGCKQRRPTRMYMVDGRRWRCGRRGMRNVYARQFIVKKDSRPLFPRPPSLLRKLIMPLVLTPCFYSR